MARKQKKGVKYCPDCGAEIDEKDKYCTKCGYSFEKRKKKKIKLRNLIILIIAIILIWLGIRIFTGNPLIPEIIKNLLVNNATNASG